MSSVSESFTSPGHFSSETRLGILDTASDGYGRLKLIDGLRVLDTPGGERMSFAYCPMCSSALIDADIEGVMRKRCSVPSCRFVHYDNPTPVVAAIVQRGHHVVLIQNKGWPTEWFGLVSGS